MRKLLWFSPLAILGSLLSPQNANAQGVQPINLQQKLCNSLIKDSCLSPRPTSPLQFAPSVPSHQNMISHRSNLGSNADLNNLNDRREFFYYIIENPHITNTNPSGVFNNN